MHKADDNLFEGVQDEYSRHYNTVRPFSVPSSRPSSHKADNPEVAANVRFWPKADMG